jgi:hypothetical protein
VVGRSDPALVVQGVTCGRLKSNWPMRTLTSPTIKAQKAHAPTSCHPLNPTTRSKMVASYLPQEIVEEIIDVLGGDTKTLLSCSLVSANWLDRSRHHLFSDVKLHSLPDLQFWFRTGLGLSSHHVCSLHLILTEEIRWIAPDALAPVQNDFTSFYNVRSLVLTGVDLTLFDEHLLVRFFGHLSERLTSLSIEHSTVNPDTLLFFVCMFPRLDNLKFNNLTMGRDTISFRNPTTVPRFRGKLTLLNIKSHGTPLTAPFANPPLPMAFKDVCIENCRFESPQSLKDLFVACGRTVKIVKVSRIYLGALPFRVQLR